MVDETVKKSKMTARDKAKIIVKMGKEADRVAEAVGAEACVVICVFRDDNKLTIQDVGKFVMPPTHFYHTMVKAHENGQLGTPKSKIIKPH